MAIVDKVTPEAIERARGTIDYYMLRGILPVARSWPKKPKPPYTALQAEGMEVFAMANKSMRRIDPNILEAWRLSTVGKKPSWTDIYRSIIMKYWKLNRSIPPIALNYTVNEESTTYQVVWRILQLYIDPLISEEIYDMQTELFSKEDISKRPHPIYFTLLGDGNERLVAPYILLEVKP